MEKRVWHTETIDEAAAALDTNLEDGLSEGEARHRLAEYGPNTLEERKKRSAFFLFLGQFNDFMIWVLIAAAFVSSVVLREVVDSLAIVAILFINAILGFIQEYRAERALEALKKLAAPQSRVVRDGAEKELPASELVPGDVIMLEGGDIIPADSRLTVVGAFLVDEAPLTGESVASTKMVDPIANPDIPHGDRDNMAYMGTTAVAGRARATVVDTGPRTEMGKIAEMIQTEEEKTPLQIELDRVGRTIAILVLIIAAIIFVSGLLRGFELALILLASVSLAVAAIPEGLPAIVTITLALGVQRMARQNAIVRKLYAVETLGSTTVINTDKTGTLTINRMTAEKLYLDGHVFDVEDKKIIQEEAEVEEEDLLSLLTIALLSNDARHGKDGKLIGDPTETALIRLGDDLGYPKEKLEAEHTRVDEIPFDSSRKRMTTINRADGGFLVLTKGAPELVLPRSLHERYAGENRWLSSDRREEILGVNNRLASEGYRTLAFAYRAIQERPREAIKAEEEIERDLIFIGIIGLTDPPRPEVPPAIETAKQAGIRVAMVTGDHKLTATAVAEKIGLLENGGVLTGVELEEMSVEDLARVVDKIGVYARVDPSHKVKIVNALKSNGEVVAMTGDGVNDAPAVKQADIGISMGQVGTDVTKEASDMILADDNFATIVRAVREGRLIFDNLKKFILFLLSANASEVLTMFIALIVGLQLPLLPIQILWINLITDGFPALALGVDVPAPGLMERPPRRAGEAILARSRLIRIVWQGFWLALATLLAFIVSLIVSDVPLLATRAQGGGALVAISQTVAFTTLVTIQLLHALNYRVATTTIFSKEVLRNKLLLIAIAGSFILQLAIIYIPFLQPIFNTRPLGAIEWLIIFAFIIPALVIIDVTKTRNVIGEF
ncbi:MAG TPA: cation-translocating P-type ATPase [Anaerolineae bacterium]|nr:cation-translocating P-type ATPase [Anaerolineae bacterium]